ncbi:hypothetical protein K7X08_036216 [Anisodus acutangulus]|uniref:Uncharacterized protein n=1 Tax=Anisodus acutangulus TaxID=402998 RepID=A0A9Q1L6B6_9SOLA|nr:hypothetical protein K7X08_036216 [Anisodus acutangulus]
MISLTQPHPTQDNHISHGKNCYGLALIALLQSGIVANICCMATIKWLPLSFRPAACIYCWKASAQSVLLIHAPIRIWL